ncbi:MAG TPA: sigma-70 family RNA polymerase sigma factor, partial [Chitinophaga sp.]
MPLPNNTHTGAGIDLTNAVTFNEIFDRYQPGLLGLAARMLGNREDAEDIITEAFLKLWQSQGQFENALAVGGWLRVTVRNHCLNFLKQRHTRQDRLNQLAAQTSNVADNWGHEDLLGELLQEVYAAANTLPEKSREVFRLRFVEGLKNEEIASRLGIHN